MVDVGVDLHKNYSQVAVLDAWGEIRHEHIEHLLGDLVGEVADDDVQTLGCCSAVLVTSSAPLRCSGHSLIPLPKSGFDLGAISIPEPSSNLLRLAMRAAE